MLERLTQKPLHEVMAAIEALDLESVKQRIMDPELGEGWTREYAESIEAAYKRYLLMQVKYPDDAEDILLSKDVDEFWHTHILQTQKYFADCQAMFGNYLHHNPHVGEITAEVQAERERQAERTRQLYEMEFGVAAQAESAWTGVPGTYEFAKFGSEILASNSALSASAIRAGNSALSASAIREANAALSASAIGARNAALSASAIRPTNAALSASAIQSNNAALSASAIHADNAALSASAIRASNAALSASSVRG